MADAMAVALSGPAREEAGRTKGYNALVTHEEKCI
jgi:hypothetical protein